jgi:hypothetical protein
VLGTDGAPTAGAGAGGADGRHGADGRRREPGSAIGRREFLLLAGAGAMAAVAVACTHGSTPRTGVTGPTSSGSIDAISQDAVQLSLINAQSEMPTGRSLFTFGLSTPDGKLVEGGSPQVYVAQSQAQPADGPFPASWYQFAPASAFNDAKTTPRSPLTGFYTAEVDIGTPGRWVFAGVAQVGGAKGVGIADLAAKSKVIAAIGSKASSVKTPVATSPSEARQICTRVPPDPMHYTSLDTALRNGKPTVVSFATPALCESRLCGPVVDEQLLVFQSGSVDQTTANFIHVEEFLPGPDLTPPAPSLQNQSPGFKAWGFTTEPWTIVIDKAGIIRARFEGPVVADQIAQALEPLL